MIASFVSLPAPATPAASLTTSCLQCSDLLFYNSLVHVQWSLHIHIHAYGVQEGSPPEHRTMCMYVAMQNHCHTITIIDVVFFFLNKSTATPRTLAHNVSWISIRWFHYGYPTTNCASCIPPASTTRLLVAHIYLP